MIKVKYIFYRVRNQGQKIPIQLHQNYEFIRYFQGDGIFEYNDTSIPFQQNFNLLLPPMTKHNEIFKSKCFSLVIGFEQVNPSYNVEKNLIIDQDKFPMPIIKKIEDEFNKKQIGYDIIIQNTIEELMIEIARHQSSSTHPVNLIKFVIGYIDQNFTSKIDLQELSSHSGYCLDHFRRVFLRTTGMLPKEYILKKRIDLAKEYIQKNDLSLTDISFECGFSNYNQFCSMFKKIEGYSPSMLKNNIK